jgi:hypothetical protein
MKSIYLCLGLLEVLHLNERRKKRSARRARVHIENTAKLERLRAITFLFVRHFNLTM